MAISPVSIAGAIQKNGASEFQGENWPFLCQAIGQATYTWALMNPFNLQLMGATSGTIGVGLAQGTLSIPPNPAIIQGSLNQQGLVGRHVPFLAQAIALGISESFASANYIGPSAGVSAGVDISKVVVSNGATLASFLLPQLIANYAGGQITEVNTKIALGISNGISLQIASGFSSFGIVVPTAPGPLPSGGVSQMGLVF